MMGLNFIVFVPMLYCTTFLGADSESYGTKLLFSGVVNAFATLLLIWIYLYTLDHVDDEKILASALLNALSEDSSMEDPTTMDDVDVSTKPIMTEESEF